jgi:glycogen debranching enzyme
MLDPQKPAPGALPRRWEHIPDVFGRVEDISASLVLREGNQFLLTDEDGNISSPTQGLGLYYRDTRHLSVHNLLIDGLPPVRLFSMADTGYTQQQVMGNRRSVQGGRVAGRCTVEIVRDRTLHDSLDETLRLTNYNPFPVELNLRYDFDADFADVFEVRGHPRERYSDPPAAQVEASAIHYAYRGVDGQWRRTSITFATPPTSLDSQHAEFVVQLGARGRAEIGMRVEFLEEPGQPETSRLARQRLQSDYDAWRGSFARVTTDNDAFNEVLSRSLDDLRMLWTPDKEGSGFLAAGVPWYSTLFGRDSIIASLQTLPYRPDVARQCLEILAAKQGRTFNEVRVEEPGKIAHELRDDELSAVGELPYARYYGSVDSTPLFILLVAEYFHWTADLDSVRRLMPAIDAALTWIKDCGDLDGDGFLEYRTDASDGLRNQGWKDSAEAIMHADGVLCEGPIALAEVQSYVFAAYERLAPVFEALGMHDRAAELRAEAQDLKQAFLKAFWLPGSCRLAMALDGDKKPSDVMSSNAGQALWGGILDPDSAAHIRDSLFKEDMFSGWGVRTLSSDATLYNPLGYHLGTVWPHDNGLIAMGLKRYGFNAEVNTLATGLFDASRLFHSQRLPELFGGQARATSPAPVPYPVACRPQAWTAGTTLHLLQAVLGLSTEGGKRLIIDRPELPVWLHDVHVERLPVGRGSVYLHFNRNREGTLVNAETDGDIEVVIRQQRQT